MQMIFMIQWYVYLRRIIIRMHSKHASKNYVNINVYMVIPM